jgi:ATP-dependent DNA helicase RecG
MSYTLGSPMAYIKGIGPERAKLIEAFLGLKVLEDLLEFFPLRYVDKRDIHLIKNLQETDQIEIQLKGQITDLQEFVSNKTKRLVGKFRDETGQIDLVWFSYSSWMKEKLPLNQEVVIFGKINQFNQSYSMVHPEVDLEEKHSQWQVLFPIYSGSEKLSKRGINNKTFQNAMMALVPELPNLLPEFLPPALIQKYQLCARSAACQNIHFPADQQALLQADKRLKYEEAFLFQLAHGLKKKHQHQKQQGHAIEHLGELFSHFYQNHLPFELTNAQKRVLKEIRKDLRRPIQMNRLLQGDVGSGKTIVGLLSMLMVVDNGFQACIMAPTEILAQQHFAAIQELLKTTDIQVGLLTGSTKVAARRKLHAGLEDGSLHLVVGTHALLEDKVQFKNLGMAIIDEQHRFGVEQRAKLWKKNTIPPHILVMTATPIPRTLAMSFYADLEVSVIDELPKGRKSIITKQYKASQREELYHFIREEIDKGRQAYVVYPLIEESETLSLQNLQDGFDELCRYFPSPKYHNLFLHGKMKPAEKEAAMALFVSGKAHIMAATTVIEVGVNVPNASVMVIESAQQFGLSQLHQLRGRVGRGAEQSYCFLLSKNELSREGRIRLKTMCETNDGFKIAEVDMALRGPGDILGTQQSGSLDFKRLSLVEDSKIIQAARQDVEALLLQDPHLQQPEHLLLRQYFLERYNLRNKWSKIS